MIAFLNSVNWLEWAKVVFDLIKGVAWPLALFMVVWIFRTQLRERIKDLISVGPGGAVLQAPVQPPVERPIAAVSAADHPMKTVQSVLIPRIESELNNLPHDDRYKQLVVALAEARIDRAFEWVFSIIFGSQILALRRLKDVPSISIGEGEAFFDEAVKPHYPVLAEAGFERWSAFLIEQKLVKVEGDRISITDLGKDFLLFVDFNKPNDTRSW